MRTSDLTGGWQTKPVTGHGPKKHMMTPDQTGGTLKVSLNSDGHSLALIYLPTTTLDSTLLDPGTYAICPLTLAPVSSIP